MKIVFLSAYFNHHQKALSDALAARSDYTYVATSEMSEMRRKLGYGMDAEPDYVLQYSQAAQEAEERLRQADVIITGSAPERLVRQCIRRNQLVFRYAERPLKKGAELWKYLPRLLKWHWQNPVWKPIYMLCASAYTAGDYAGFGLFRGKAFRWGYFPETRTYETIEDLLEKKKKASLLWVGRFLDWKHPDDALRVAAGLRAESIPFELNFIGNGPMEEILRERIAEEGLDEQVHLLGSMKPEEVRRYMEQSEILLFTSDRREGWGAVVNEAMNSGCVVIASDAAGATPFLIRDGENGLTYPSGHADVLAEQVKMILQQPMHTKKLGMNAYQTVINQWNAETAAMRLVALAERITTGDRTPVCQEGPCSAAEVLREDWNKR